MSIAVLRFIGFILGIFLITLAVSMSIPMLTLVIYERNDDMSAFLWSSLIDAMAEFQGRPVGLDALRKLAEKSGI